MEDLGSNVDDAGDRKLSDIFDEALSNYEEIVKSNELSSNAEFQMRIHNTIQQFEGATKLINLAGVFSCNEQFSEISTPDIKYLLIPACLGNLVTMVQSPDRLATLETAEVYFKDFLKRLQDYEVIPRVGIPELEENETAVSAPRKLDLEQMARERNAKIQKYKQQKEMESEMTKLKNLLNTYDEDVTRKYYETYLKSQTIMAVDELNSIRQEKPLARHMAENKQNTFAGSEAERKIGERARVPPLRPVIITRNELQKKVFGAGYPSLPTMTVDEFYQQRVAEGIFPAEGSKYSKTLQDLADSDISKAEDEKEDIRKEQEIEQDDPEVLAKARTVDEYKDDHKRGWGNRMNRS